MSRDITMKEQVFASGALTEIPIPPIAGTPYRKPLASDGEIKPGWKYRDIVDSAAFNEVMYRTTSLVNQLEKDGVLIWSNKTNYPEKGIAKGPTDGKLYQAVQASGPGTPAGTKDPANGANPTYWVDYLEHLLPTASSSVKGGVKVGSGLTMDGETLKVSSFGSVGFPDWDNPVALLENTTYTASVDGWVFISMKKETTGVMDANITINGTSVLIGTLGFAGETPVVYIPIKTGDVYRYDKPSNVTMYHFNFYPNR